MDVDITTRAAEVVDRYGRLGLLADDSPRAAHRVARELYGTELLPSWWLVVRSRRCAGRALEAMSRLRHRQFPCLVLIDRYLPEICGGQAENAWPDADLLTRTQDLGSEPLKPAFFSSYPYAAYEADGRALDWQPRDSETIVSIRRKLEDAARAAANLKPLLRFAPSDWADKLARLAAMFSSPSGIQKVLLTGAGVSMAESDSSPGMPSTEWLLSTAVSYAFGIETEIKARRFPPAPGCCRRDDDVDVVHESSSRQGAALLERARDELQEHGRLGSDWWTLPTLVDPESNGDHRTEALVVLRHFGRLMLRYDRDFPSTHWFLAHLPWNRIVTTNFDTFHERASLQAVAMWRGRDGRPDERLGYTDKGVTARGSAETGNELATEPGLRKPYGSLSHPEILALTGQQMASREKHFQRSFAGIDGPICLVVAGHSMRDPWICRWIERNKRRIRAIYWVDRMANRPPTLSSGWDALLTEHEIIRLQGRAVDFAHDLYMEYRRFAVMDSRRE